MKKYLKMFSFFTEKRNIKRFYVSFIFILGILLFPKNTYALAITDWGTQDFADKLTSTLNNVFTYENLVYSINRSRPTNSGTAFGVFPIKSGTPQPCIDEVSGSYYLVYYDEFNAPKYYYSFATTFDRINTTNYNYSQVITAFNSSLGQGVSNASYFKSSVDLYSCSNSSTKVVSKTFNYTPPVGNCPTCEECEECEECENGGGPVEVSNFPFDKTEFYVLLVLLAVLILMLFFKWCFPMKGGKDN